MTRLRPRTAIFAGIAATFAAAALWHGPIGGAGARVVAESETLVKLNLDYYEMNAVTGWMQRGPVTRRIWLAGEADNFQRRELARLLDTLPNVEDVQWWKPGGGTVRGEIVLPLVVEAELAAFGAFAAGLMLSYLVARRRRAIADAAI